MRALTIKEVERIVHDDENRVMEAKKTTGELVSGMQSWLCVPEHGWRVAVLWCSPDNLGYSRAGRG